MVVINRVVRLMPHLSSGSRNSSRALRSMAQDDPTSRTERYPETTSAGWVFRTQIVIVSLLLTIFTNLSPVTLRDLPQEPAKIVIELRRAQRQASWASYLQLGRMISGVEQEAGITDHRMPAVVIAGDLVGCVPVLCWQLLLLFLWLLLLWRGLPWWRQQRRGRLITLCLAIMLIGGVTWYASQQRTRLQAVATQSLQLRAGPSERYAQLTTLPAVTTVDIFDSAGSGAQLFYKVQAGPVRGWAAHIDMTVI